VVQGPQQQQLVQLQQQPHKQLTKGRAAYLRNALRHVPAGGRRCCLVCARTACALFSFHHRQSPNH
jgi:hypothetical protein